MKTPAFWRAGAGGWQAALLAPLGWLYGRLTLARMARQGWRAPVPVIAIGNFTAGGAGKTPTAIALAKALKAEGERPFILSRGYGGHYAGTLRVEGQDPRLTGDEPQLLARAAPTILARDRAAGARRAVDEGASCLILDDALQNPALHKDFTLALIDGGFGLGNGAVVPAGPLRAPLEGQLPHVDAVMVVGEAAPALRAAIGNTPCFAARLVASPEASALAGQAVIGFCGLGLPEKFEASLAATGARVLACHRFADHHAFSEAEAQALMSEAQAKGARLVTTAKDHVRLSGAPALHALAGASTVLDVEMVLEDALLARIRAVISARRAPAA